MKNLFQPLLLLIAGATQKELARQIRYLKVENEILRSKLPSRVTVTEKEKNRLAKFAAKLGSAINELVSIVHPETLRRWIRSLNQTVKKRVAKRGRPKTDAEIRELILKLARENDWGYTRIMGELKKLGITPPSRNTIKNILKEHGLDPGPKRGEGTWDEFLKSHAQTLWQCDFLSKKTLTIKGFRDLYVLIFLHVAILDDVGSMSQGAKWLRRLINSVVDHVRNGIWPNNAWWGWSDLAIYLRPDQPGTQEKKVLFRLLASESNLARRRCIELLLSPNILQGYKAVTATGSRGDLDRTILAQEIDSQVKSGGDNVDHLIRYAVSLIETYEQVSGELEAAFRGLMWALTRRGGRSSADDLLGDSTVIAHLAESRRKLTVAAKRFQSLMSEIGNHPQVLDAVNQERLDRLMQDALDGLASERSLVHAVMGRHRHVQEQKRKGVWIEQDHPYWTLMPGFGDSSDTPWSHGGAYLHPFRVSNAYSLLSDLGKVRGVEVPDGEED